MNQKSSPLKSDSIETPRISLYSGTSFDAKGSKLDGMPVQKIYLVLRTIKVTRVILLLSMVTLLRKALLTRQLYTLTLIQEK